jgi:hypothetical protein
MSGFEIDHQVVAMTPPSPRLREQRRPAGRRIAGPRQPGRVGAFDRPQAGNECREASVPSPDRQIDLRIRPRPSHGADGLERHEQVSDAFQAKQQDAADAGSRRTTTEPLQWRDREVGQADEPALAGIVDLEG